MTGTTQKTETTHATETTEKPRDPMADVKAAFGEWRKLLDEQWMRVDQAWAEVGRIEKQGFEQMATAVDEMGRVLKGSLEFAQKMSTEFRSVAQQTARRANEVITSLVNKN